MVFSSNIFLYFFLPIFLILYFLTPRIMMFPQLIAGPIVNYNTVAAQLISRESTMEGRVLGFYRFVIGLSKKVFIANTLADVRNITIDSCLRLNAVYFIQSHRNKQ